jgi:hypothetical protein
MRSATPSRSETCVSDGVIVSASKDLDRQSRLVEFYAGRATDFAGRRIDDIWRMSLDDLEYNHDYIQWLFPLRERSGVHPDVPVLDHTTIRAFATPGLQERLARSASVMAEFYGLEIVDDGAHLAMRRSSSFEERRRNWLTRGNHNFLRLTRIMKSLAILGRGDLARAWLGALLSIYDEYGDDIGPTTVAYWRAAVVVTRTVA